MKNIAVCPECGEEMKTFWRTDGNVTRSYENCPACRYVVSTDFVSGFWTGVRAYRAGRVSYDLKINKEKED